MYFICIMVLLFLDNVTNILVTNLYEKNMIAEHNSWSNFRICLSSYLSNTKYGYVIVAAKHDPYPNHRFR